MNETDFDAKIEEKERLISREDLFHPFKIDLYGSSPSALSRAFNIFSKYVDEPSMVMIDKDQIKVLVDIWKMKKSDFIRVVEYGWKATEDGFMAFYLGE